MPNNPTLKQLEALARNTLPLIRIPVIELSDESNYEWWESFVIRAKAFFAKLRLGCCFEDIQLDATRHIRAGPRFGMASLEALTHLVEQGNDGESSIRCFFIIHSWSPKLDAVKMVVLTDSSPHDKYVEKMKQADTDSKPSFKVHSDCEPNYWGRECPAEPTTGVCWGNFCGPRFMIEWALRFQENPVHVHEVFKPPVPYMTNRQLKEARQEERRLQLTGEYQCDKRESLGYDEKGIARTSQYEGQTDAHKTSSYSDYLKTKKCACYRHEQRKAEWR